MNERSLRVLEFPKIAAMLRERTAFAPGAELAEKLQPMTDIAAVQTALAETAEALRLLEKGGPDLLAGARDVREAVRRAAIGGVLSPTELLDVAGTAATVRRARRVLLHEPDEQPQLAARTVTMVTFAELEQSVAACIGDDGQVLDKASPKLAQLRARIRTWQTRSRERLDAVLRAAAARNVLQDTVVTMRNGRYVIPVKSEQRAAVPGIVHDTSASGATLFVEPMPVVELNNQISEARAEEEREVERILRELSQRVHHVASDLLAAIDVLAELDLIFAKARLAQAMDAHRPEMNDEGWIHIRGGRHPLLSGKVVPIDVWIGRDVRALVITGPNTGGKTVTLKTIGLFSLMAQAGLFVPAKPGTELAVFRGIYADIGDEQSIEQNLSTFSSHMANIVDILRGMDERSLVLFDELGAGTDPAEGAALAMAILEHVQNRGALVVATTHYSELKAFVHSRPGMENASVEFDPDTLAPTYRLLMGMPGRSNALEIAARLGLSDDILERARGQFSRHDDVRVEDLIRDLEEATRTAEEERREAARVRQEAERLREELATLRADWRRERDELMRQARDEASAIVRQARLEAESIIAALRRRQDEIGVEQAREGRAHLAAHLKKLQEAPSESEVDEQPVSVESSTKPLHVGDTVRVKTINQTGELLSGPDADGQWTVLIGRLRMVVPENQLVPVASANDAKASADDSLRTGKKSALRRPGAALAASKRGLISPEVHLRGLTVDEALGALEKYLDDAVLAGLDVVRVVHGKGTGTLRQVVHDYVRTHPRVRDYYIADPAEGGYGVTIVELD